MYESLTRESQLSTLRSTRQNKQEHKTMEMLVVKLNNGGDVRRVTFGGADADLTFAALESKARGLFGLASTESVTFKYRDCDGDTITVASEDDVAEFRLQKLEGPIRFEVTRGAF